MDKENLLKSLGLKITQGRVAILDFLSASKDPVDVYTIVEGLKKHADQATVYRSLDLLTQKGIISRLEFGEGKYRYEIIREHHHHTICTKCGRVEDIEGDFVSDLEEKIKKDSGFLVTNHTLEFFGICLRCQE